MEETKKVVEYNKTKKTLDLSIPMNFWFFSTMILLVVVIVLAFMLFNGNTTGNVVANTNIPAANTATKTATAASAVAPKTDKPKVDAYVYSYCPYGLQFEKALSPVYDLLKDKADFNIVFIGAMHGEYEKVESLRQLCIQKNYGKDKLWAYLNDFNLNTDIGKCKKGEEVCVTPLIDKIFTSRGIDKSKIETCMKNDAEALYNKDLETAKGLGIGSSPTFVVNGAKLKVTRSPEAIKQAVCGAFNSAPSVCNTALQINQTSSGFGAGTSATTTSAAC